jgi:tRNA 5-methylaminomethyl-2-thiouridine biosynthesis bifunctional protein
MQNTPRSKEFDDVYFSESGGLAETRHVFLEANGLPARWKGRPQFTIFETGFGTGLNFLAAWKLFRETRDAGAHLDFISVEKFPLDAGQIGEYLSGWGEELKYELQALCSHYPKEIKGTQRIFMDESATLTLHFDDVNNVMPMVQDKIDCWFLDGFKPSSNPDMWTDVLFQNMARLSNPGATFATFTAAGVVKRGLKDAGFVVEKKDGFGWKRDMLAGHMT